MDQRLLIIDDEKAVRDVIGSLMEAQGYAVSVASDGEQALQLLSSRGPNAFDFILCDVKMPKIDGIEFLKRAKAQGCGATFIMMSGYGTVDTAVEAMKLGAYDYISKPFKADEVLIVLRKAAERDGLIRENRELKRTLQKEYEFENIVAKSPSMKGILDLIAKVTDYRSNVLIQGEPGSGKELVARAVHFNSKRREQPFVTINCGAIPDHLLEGELFGYEEGIAADKLHGKRGPFEEAHGGTLLLDEVCELPAFLQVAILKVVQTGRIRRVGGTQEVPVDVRLVAASHRDLQKDVEDGRFREDLFYRLNVIPIRIPPLRERREDIPPLVDYFLRRYSAEIQKDVRSVTPEAMDALLHGPWRGNVRELENAVERAVVLADG
ncbi:MAG: sigma-54-dependent Fis family transcriptional regulator, partial [Deltaproteobacteria bacterium]|nr:sigma-54-dependent Fis family transcriptional regulator [Deltaproteobacteria bacterium]